MEQIYKPKGNYRVFVRCNTFNQSKYIEDALNGFAMQQTNFPFVCLMMDDCSTDGEQDVIKAWMERECDIAKAEHFETELSNIILVPHKSNANCYFAFYLLKRNTWKERNLKVSMYTPWREHCEYEALCEGDDYWIDPMKLQKQVDYLDEHPDYSMCFHDATETWEDGRKPNKSFSNVEDRDYTGLEIYKKWTIPTASVLIRKEAIESEYYKNLSCNPNFCYGDIILYISCAHYGKLRGMSNTMSVYRRHEGSAVFTTSSLRRFYHYHEIYTRIGNEYKEFSRQMFFYIFEIHLAKDKNISFKKKVSLYLCCIKASPLKAIWRLIRITFKQK